MALAEAASVREGVPAHATSERTAADGGEGRWRDERFQLARA